MCWCWHASKNSSFSIFILLLHFYIHFLVSQKHATCLAIVLPDMMVSFIWQLPSLLLHRGRCAYVICALCWLHASALFVRVWLWCHYRASLNTLVWSAVWYKCGGPIVLTSETSHTCWASSLAVGLNKSLRYPSASWFASSFLSFFNDSMSI